MFNRFGFGGEPKKDYIKNKPNNSNNNQNKQQKGSDKNSLSSLLQKRQHPDKHQLNPNQNNKQGQQNKQHNNEKQQNNQKQHQNHQKNEMNKLNKKEQKNKDKNNDLTKRIEEGLVGSKFRMINEYFYTTDSKTSADHFSQHKEDFLLVNTIYTDQNNNLNNVSKVKFKNGLKNQQI